mgnify:CR=1 FL=1
MSKVEKHLYSTGLGTAFALLLAAGPAIAQDASSAGADAAPVPAAVQTAIINPNLDEWNLVSLNSADVASANGGSDSEDVVLVP